MAPRDVIPPTLPLRVLLLGLMTSSVLTASLGSARYPICDVPCCEVEPSCDDATHVTCDCPDIKSMALHKGDFPKFIQGIDIRIGTQMTIHREAFQHLTSLTTVHLDLRRSGTLEIKPDGLHLAENTTLYSVSIENVKTAEVASSAFTGLWKNVRIHLQYAERLQLHGGAFRWKSRPHNAPTLIMDRVQDLQLSPDAINSPIKHLELRNVNMASCVSGSIGGPISHLVLNHVNVQHHVHTGCIKGSEGSRKISIFSCNFGIVETQGISGQTHEVEMRDTSISTIHQNGLSLRVGSFSIKATRFQKLDSNGLNITSDSILLEKVRIEVLRKYGLAALHATNNKTKPMHLDSLTILETEQGSLAFANGLTPRFQRLEVSVPDPPICPTERWVRRLVGATENDQLPSLEREILRQLRRDWLCPERDDTVSETSTIGPEIQEQTTSQAEDGIHDLHVAHAVSPNGRNFDMADATSHEKKDSAEAIVVGFCVALAILAVAGISVWFYIRANGDKRSGAVQQQPRDERQSLTTIVSDSAVTNRRRRNRGRRREIKSFPIDS